jgi:hypothetical protein
MDGPRPTPARSALRRLLAAGLALLALGAGAAPVIADDGPVTDPAARWPATGTAIQTALGLAAEHWGFAPCRGRVTVAWTPLDGLDGQATWANDLDPYRQPSRNTDCEIALSPAEAWDWPKLCTVVIHEAGHLAGHDHVDDPGDVMFATFVQPEPECTATPEPAQVAAPAAPRAAPPAARRAAKRSTAKRSTAKRARPAPRRRATAPRRHR